VLRAPDRFPLMTTYADAIAEAAEQLAPSLTARRDAELLLVHVTGTSRTKLFTHPGRELTPAQLAAYRSATARRAKQEPVQYITGVQEFYGRPFLVTSAVLIPRPETEHLVDAVLQIRPQPRHILDIGTGSGILAITLAFELPHAGVVAVDLSPAALGVAEQNAAALSVTERIRFLESDLLAALPGEAFDCIVANPPYVSADEVLEPQVSRYEPASALYAGADGLEIYRRLIPQAAAALLPGGHLLLELGQGQLEAVKALLGSSGFGNIQVTDDLQGISRVASAQKPPLKSQH
jgi:release factor glutamine methyltransferase